MALQSLCIEWYLKTIKSFCEKSCIKAEYIFNIVVEFVSHGSSSPFCLRCHYNEKERISCQNEKINRQKLQKAENSTSLLFGLCIFSILRRRDTFRFLKNTAEVQRIVIAYNTSNLINAIMLILQKHFCIIYSFFHNKLFWCNSSI